MHFRTRQSSSLAIALVLAQTFRYKAVLSEVPLTHCNPMPTTKIEAEVRACVDRFVGELTTLVQQSTIASIQDAIGGSLSAPARAPRTARPATRKAGPKKRIRRSSESVEALGGKVASYVSANPGSSISEICSSLGATTKDVRLPLQKLMAEGAVKTTGQKRGTRYHPAGKAGGGRKKKAARKKKGSPPPLVGE